MKPLRILATVVFLCLAGTRADAALPAVGKPFDASGLLPALAGGSTDTLAGAIRGYLVKSMPEPLYEKILSNATMPCLPKRGRSAGSTIWACSTRQRRSPL